MKYFIYQGNDHDCGFAALKMLLANLAKDKSYLYIPKPAKREFYTLEDLNDIAKLYGVELEANGCTRDYIDSLESPSLVLLEENHMVMIKKKTKNSLIVYDPGRGVIKMRKDEFLRRWRCIVIAVDHPENIIKMEKKRQYLLPPKLDLLSGLVALFSASLLIVAFYLLNAKENFLFSLLFLFLFIMGQMVEKMLLFNQVYRFDMEFIPKYFNIKENCTKESYTKYVDFKKSFFLTNRQLISSLLIAFTITFLLILNDFRNVFALLALVLLKILEIILFSRKEQDTKNYIAELESRTFSEPDTAKDLALEANTKADKHIFYTSIKDLFYIFASFIFSVLTMFITNNSGCNFVIFHFVMYYAGFIAYNQLLTNLSLRKENKQKEVRFFDSCNL